MPLQGLAIANQFCSSFRSFPRFKIIEKAIS